MSVDSAVTEAGSIVTNPVAPGSEDSAVMTDLEARTQTKNLIEFRDGVQSFGISWISEGNLSNAPAYQYKDWQKNKLIDAWTPIVAQYNLKLSPWANVVMTELICTAPLVGLAFQNRKLRLEIEQLKAKFQQTSAFKTAATAAGEYKDARTDSKTSWTIDEDGYFTNTPKGTYIRKTDRSEKPTLTPENYELLVKHNGKEFVDKALKITT